MVKIESVPLPKNELIFMLSTNFCLYQYRLVTFCYLYHYYVTPNIASRISGGLGLRQFIRACSLSPGRLPSMLLFLRSQSFTNE